MYNTDQILAILRDRKPDLQKRYPLSELGLFGSYARGDFNEKKVILISLSILVGGLMGLNIFAWYMNWKML